jgi:hypothetical protein
MSVGTATTSNRCPAPSATRSAIRSVKSGKTACAPPATADTISPARIARRGPTLAVIPPENTPKRMPITATPDTAKATGAPG